MACVSATPDKAPVRYGSGAQAWLLDNGSRLHLQHGPIDLIVEAVGALHEVHQAYRQATHAFQSVLATLAAQLPVLRKQLDGTDQVVVHGDVARRMVLAAQPLHAFDVTPMIAVAGAVADHICMAMLAARELERVQVNNGGDIALYLNGNSRCRIGIANRADSTSHPDIITINGAQRIGGVATSGWQGRSHSLGIADAVTVLAADSALADAAATVIANAVDLPGSQKIDRTPAWMLNPDSDLCERAVTTGVARLSPSECHAALSAGSRLARQLRERGLVRAAYLHLQDHSCVIGEVNEPMHKLPAASRYAFQLNSQPVRVSA